MDRHIQFIALRVSHVQVFPLQASKLKFDKPLKDSDAVLHVDNIVSGFDVGEEQFRRDCRLRAALFLQGLSGPAEQFGVCQQTQFGARPRAPRALSIFQRVCYSLHYKPVRQLTLQEGDAGGWRQVQIGAQRGRQLGFAQLLLQAGCLA